MQEDVADVADQLHPVGSSATCPSLSATHSHLHCRSDNDDHDIHHDESHARYVIYEQRHEPPTNIVRLANQNKQGLILAKGLRAAPPATASEAASEAAARLAASTVAVAADCVREQRQM
jgi:hypothetical protein